jgi:pyruvate kinase
MFSADFSHGAHEDKLKIIEHIRNINKTEPYNIAILGDLQGQVESRRDWKEACW